METVKEEREREGYRAWRAREVRYRCYMLGEVIHDEWQWMGVKKAEGHARARERGAEY